MKFRIKKLGYLVILLTIIPAYAFAIVSECGWGFPDFAEAGVVIRNDPVLEVEIAPHTSQYRQLIDKVLRGFTLATMRKTFGNEIKSFPKDKSEFQIADQVKPVFAPECFEMSGWLGTDKRHTDIFAIEKLGYLVAYFGDDGVTPFAAQIFHRVDTDFVALKTRSDFGNRLSWDTAHFAKIKRIVDEGISKPLT